MRDSLRHVALLKLVKVEPGGKILAFGHEQHRADVIGQRGKEAVDAANGLVVERVAFVLPFEPQNRHRALPLGAK